MKCITFLFSLFFCFPFLSIHTTFQISLLYLLFFFSGCSKSVPKETSQKRGRIAIAPKPLANKTDPKTKTVFAEKSSFRKTLPGVNFEKPTENPLKRKREETSDSGTESKKLKELSESLSKKLKVEAENHAKLEAGDNTPIVKSKELYLLDL